MATEKKLFVRKATGLVREIGALTAVIIVIANTVGLGWQKRAFQWTGPAIVPESSYVLGMPPISMAFILVGIVVLLTVVVFAILGTAMPRSGGGYVYISRILSPPVGFIASWMEYFSIAVSYGLIGTAVFEAILIYGWLARLPGGFLTAISSSEVLFLGGVVIVLLFGVVAAFGTKMTGALLQVIFWVPAVLTIVIYGLMLAATPQSIEAGFRQLTGVSPAQLTQKALDLGMAKNSFLSGGGNYWGAVGVAAIGAYWAYIGFAASTFVAGEMKEVSRNLPRTLFMANIFIVLLYVSFSLLAFRAASSVGKVGDYSFFSGYAYLSYGVSGGLQKAGIDAARAWTPNLAGFAAYGMGLGGLVLLIPVFAVLWVANDIPPFILTSSRIIFAMAFDRVLPEKFAEVNERWHSPVNAVIVTVAVALIGNFAESDLLVKWFGEQNILARFVNSGGGVTATDIWDTLFFLLASIAGLLFVFRRKDLFEKSSYKPMLGTLPLVVLVGAAATVGNLWLMWFAEINTYGGIAGLTSDPWIFTYVLIIVGLAIFYYYRSKGSRAGVDYSTIYAEIPPE